jgi:hypothetical protein
VKAARAITRALDDMASDDRVEALALALPQDDPTTQHVRYRMGLEAVCIVLNDATYGDPLTAKHIAKRSLGK